MLKTDFVIPELSWSILSAPSDKEGCLKLLQRMEGLGVSLLHYDISDAEKSMAAGDIPFFREHCSLPMDVHIANKNAIDVWREAHPLMQRGDYLALHPGPDIDVEKVMQKAAQTGYSFGLALDTDAPVDEISTYIDALDFVLIMAAEPGVSGGKFDQRSFDKIASLRKTHPNLRIHVDGGVDHYSAAMLRAVNVEAMISGSYLTKASDGAESVVKLLGRNFLLEVGSVMRTGESITLLRETATIQELAAAITEGGIGCAGIVDDANRFLGIITDGDLRRCIAADELPKKIGNIINKRPITAAPDMALLEFLNKVNAMENEISVFPVIVEDRCVGMLKLHDIMKFT